MGGLPSCALRWCSAFALIMVTGWCHAQQMNTLTKMFHHEASPGESFVDKTVFYFSQHPICNNLAHRATADVPADGYVHEDYFFPMTKVKSSAQRMMREIAQRMEAPDRLFYVTCQEVSTPVPGVKCHIAYDPLRISFVPQTAAAIVGDTSVIFNFYHKDTLKMATTGGSYKRYASRDTQGTKKKSVRGAKRPHVVVDFGHGGHDDGKVGFFGIKEKDVNYAVGQRVVKKLKQRGYQVSLTRHADEYCALDERTALANKARADVFLSLHANSAPSDTIMGVETFCITPHLFKTLPSMTSQPTADSALWQNDLWQGNDQFAQSLHTALIDHLRTVRDDVKDRTVKHVTSQVTLGTQMPSALIEMGFLSNEHEARLLQSHAYQDALATGIVKGIEDYFKKVVA